MNKIIKLTVYIKIFDTMISRKNWMKKVHENPKYLTLVRRYKIFDSTISQKKNRWKKRANIQNSLLWSGGTGHWDFVITMHRILVKLKIFECNDFTKKLDEKKPPENPKYLTLVRRYRAWHWDFVTAMQITSKAKYLTYDTLTRFFVESLHHKKN